MRARYLPLLSLLAACAGGAAAVESSPATASTIASGAVDPLECALHFLGNTYQRESGSVDAGFIRFNTYRQRGGMMTVPNDSSILTVTRTNGVLRVDGPLHNESTVRAMRASCEAPAAASAPSAAEGN